MQRMTDAPGRPKAYSYIRFSTPEQAAGDSLRRQTAKAREYAARHESAGSRGEAGR
jgi:DNA invertase Pin-like site-specific DNA recombinase